MYFFTKKIEEKYEMCCEMRCARVLLSVSCCKETSRAHASRETRAITRACVAGPGARLPGKVHLIPSMYHKNCKDFFYHYKFVLITTNKN